MSHLQELGWLAANGTWYDEETGALLLLLTREAIDLPNDIVAFRGKVFDPKDEVHITIVGRASGRRVKEAVDRDLAANSCLKRAIDETNWAYRIQGRMYHVRKEKEVKNEQGDLDLVEAESIIVMAEVAGLQSFYERLDRMIEMNLELPPTHVTLYTRGDPLGIGLSNQEDFEAFVTREIWPTELKELCPANLDVILESLPEVQAGIDLWQNDYHEFDVHDHTVEFVKYVKKMTDDVDIVAAGYLHDIGKPVVAKPKDGDPQKTKDGKPYNRFPDHEEVGRQMVSRMDPRLFEKLGLDQDRVASLVGCHYVPMKGIKVTRETTNYGDFLREYQRLETRLQKLRVSKEDVLTMFWADRLAQGKCCKDKEECLAMRDALLAEESDPRGVYEIQKEMYGNKA